VTGLNERKKEKRDRAPNLKSPANHINKQVREKGEKTDRWPDISKKIPGHTNHKKKRGKMKKRGEVKS